MSLILVTIKIINGRQLNIYGQESIANCLILTLDASSVKLTGRRPFTTGYNIYKSYTLAVIYCHVPGKWGIQQKPTPKTHACAKKHQPVDELHPFLSTEHGCHPTKHGKPRQMDLTTKMYTWGGSSPQYIKFPLLMILAMYEAKNSKICNFWTFLPLIQLINHCSKKGKG